MVSFHGPLLLRAHEIPKDDPEDGEQDDEHDPKAFFMSAALL
jgi:hypothetical protein